MVWRNGWSDQGYIYCKSPKLQPFPKKHLPLLAGWPFRTRHEQIRMLPPSRVPDGVSAPNAAQCLKVGVRLKAIDGRGRQRSLSLTSWLRSGASCRAAEGHREEAACARGRSTQGMQLRHLHGHGLRRASRSTDSRWSDRRAAASTWRLVAGVGAGVWAAGGGGARTTVCKPEATSSALGSLSAMTWRKRFMGEWAAS
jgi:hypothetical protein